MPEISLIFLEEKFFRIKVVRLEQKKKNQKINQKNQKRKEPKHFSNILRMNQRILAMNCLKNISILKYLLFWQKKYSKQKIKIKTMG